jgi:hypothetical protein
MQVATGAETILIQKFVGHRCTIQFKNGTALSGKLKYDDNLRTFYLEWECDYLSWVRDSGMTETFRYIYFDIGAVEHIYKL